MLWPETLCLDWIGQTVTGLQGLSNNEGIAYQLLQQHMPNAIMQKTC